MKKLFVCTLIACFAMVQNVDAQSYGPIEWDVVRLGYVLPSGDGVSGGLAFGSELRYNVNDQISAGLRAEFALFGSGDVEGVDVGAAGSYALIGDYYFSAESNKRPFAGLGIGTFSSGSVTVTNPDGSETEVDGGSSIGVIPRVGYELGLLRLSAEYNLLFDEGTSNYIGIHLGLTIGGRYKG